MNPITLIEKLINEHGSSSVLKERLELLRDQISILEKENSVLKLENATLKDKEHTINSEFNKATKEIERLNQIIERLKKDDTKVHLDAIKEKILKFFFDACCGMSVEDVAASLSMNASIAQYHFDLLLEDKLIAPIRAAFESSWARESGPALFEITSLGRKYVIENRLV